MCATIIRGTLGVVLLLLLSTGCKPEQKSKPIVVEVLTNAVEIQAAKKAWADERENKLARLLERPESIRAWDPESLELVRSDRERSVAALTGLRDDASKPALARLQAAFALGFLDLKPSPQWVIDTVRNDPESTRELLSRLDSEDLFPRDSALPPEVRDFVLKCLVTTNAGAFRLAANFAAARNMGEAGAVLEERLGQGSKPDLGLLSAAAKLCPSTNVLRHLQAELQVGDVFSGAGVLSAIASIVQGGTNQALRWEAARVCARHLKNQPDQPWIDGDTLSAVGAIAQLQPGAEAAMMLSDLVTAGKWERMRRTALAQLAELNAEMARQLAERTGLQLSSDGVERQAHQPGIDPAEIAAICVRHGMLASEEAEEALNRLRTPDPKRAEGGYETSGPEGFLYAAGRFLIFDVETGVCPTRHDLLIQDLARASAGRFRPEASAEKYEEPRTGSGTGSYQVQFVLGEKLYRFQPNDYGDWYDLQAVLKAVNQALEQSGISERFVPLEAGGQDAALVFARPAALVAAAAELGLKVGKDPDQSRQIGKAAEERVLEELRK